MKALTEYKDEIAKKHGYKDFMGVLKSFDCAKATYAEVNSIINEAMQHYSSELLEQNKQMKKALQDVVKYFEEGYELPGKPNVFHESKHLLTQIQNKNGE